jgi:predicted MFS family arabinose efflux permease
MKRPLIVQVPAFVVTRVVINTMIRMVYPFLYIFGHGLGVDLRALSIGLTLRSASGIFGPFLASVGDVRGRKTGMLFGVFLFTTGVSLMVIWPTYLAFVATLVLTMVGNLVFTPSMQAYLGDRIPYQRRGRVLALTEFGWSISFIIGVPLIGLAIARLGWLAPFPLLAGLGVTALGVLALLLPNDRPAAGDRQGLWQSLRTVLTFAPALAGIALAISVSGSNELVNVIFGVWLEDAFQVKIAALAAASAIIGISELGGESLVSVFSDRLGKRRSVSIGLAVNSLAVLALPWLGRSLTGALVGLFFFYLSFEFTVVSAIPMMTEIMPNSRATLMAIFVACF